MKKDHYNSYIVSWDDGPSEPQVSEIIRLFKDEGWDGMTDSSYSIDTLFNRRYGGIGYISINRNISDAVRNLELGLLNKELNKEYQIDDYVEEKRNTASSLVYQRIYKKDYSPEVRTETKPAKNNKPADKVPSLGGSFNGRLSCGPGWIFSKSKIDTVKQTLNIK